ncbi:MAG: hypothetical protein ACFCU1_09900 [Sumerlaeia bacterium]
MNKKTQIIAGVITLVIIVGIVLMLNRGGNQPEVVATDSPAETPAPRVLTTDQTSASLQPVETPAPQPTPDSVEPVATPEQEQSFLQQLDPSDQNQIPLTVAELDMLVEEHGVLEVYKRLYYYNRLTMQDYFFGHPEELRGNLVGLMNVEEDADLRMLLVEMLEPTYVPRESDSYDEAKLDSSLLELLNAPTATPLSADEWNARQVLAGLVSDEAAIEYARRSLEEFPENDVVGLVSSAHILRYGNERAPVSPAEASSARAELKRILSSDDYFTNFPTEKRLLAFEALVKNADQETLAFLRSVQAKEPINHVSQAMNAFLP